MDCPLPSAPSLDPSNWKIGGCNRPCHTMSRGLDRRDVSNLPAEPALTGPGQRVGDSFNAEPVFHFISFVLLLLYLAGEIDSHWDGVEQPSAEKSRLSSEKGNLRGPPPKFPPKKQKQKGGVPPPPIVSFCSASLFLLPPFLPPPSLSFRTAGSSPSSHCFRHLRFQLHIIAYIHNINK